MKRRRFLQCSTAAAAGAGLGWTILPSRAHAVGYPANGRLRLAVFGHFYNAPHFLHSMHVHDTEIVALADADILKLEPVFGRWQEQAAEEPRYQRLADRQGLSLVTDIRELFAERDSLDFDALVVSEQDHLHGVACGLALRAGIPVFNERPLGLHLADARALRALAATTGLPTSYRSPGTASGAFRHAVEMVAAGDIGEVREVHVWFDRAAPDRDAVPDGAEPVPQFFNWNAWLGPLPWREYHREWRSYPHWRETSSGGLGVFGPHTMVFPFVALRLAGLWQQGTADPADADAELPEIEVTAEVSRLNQVSFPRWERVRWQLPARGPDLPALNIHWHHGPGLPPGSRDLLHDRLARAGIGNPDQADGLLRMAGSMLIGSEGVMLADDHSANVTTLPAERFAHRQPDQPTDLPRSRGLYVDWLDACRGEDSAGLADFQLAGRLSELLMLGNLATLNPDAILHYRPADGRVRSSADGTIAPAAAYREGWPPPW